MNTYLKLKFLNRLCMSEKDKGNLLAILDKEVESYLEERNGKDWRIQYESELDSLIAIERK